MLQKFQGYAVLLRWNGQTLKLHYLEGFYQSASALEDSSSISLADLPKFEESPEVINFHVSRWSREQLEGIEWSPLGMKIPEEIDPRN